MTRTFKMAGVLMAVVAMFALTASSASATFTSSSYPQTPHAVSTLDKFDAFGSTVECTNNTFDVETFNVGGVGTPLHKADDTVTVTPHYTNCKAFGLPATVNFTGCDYVFHNPPGATNVTSDLVCPVGVKGVDITVFGSSAHSLPALCHVTVTPFNGKTGLKAHNNGKHILLTGAVEGIVAHQIRESIACPPGAETNAAKYTVQAAGITVTSNNGATLSVS